MMGTGGLSTILPSRNDPVNAGDRFPAHQKKRAGEDCLHLLNSHLMRSAQGSGEHAQLDDQFRVHLHQLLDEGDRGKFGEVQF